MDYRQKEMEGPPYSVNYREVQELFGARFSINQLDSLDLLKDSDRYSDRGLTHLIEQVYQLRCR